MTTRTADQIDLVLEEAQASAEAWEDMPPQPTADDPITDLSNTSELQPEADPSVCSRRSFLQIFSAVVVGSALGVGCGREPSNLEKLIDRLFEQDPKINPDAIGITPWRFKAFRDVVFSPNSQRDFVAHRKNSFEGDLKRAPSDFQDMLDGWNRLISQELPDGRAHLEMVYDECLAGEVPFELVFLAMAESYWKNVVSPDLAVGTWQFRWPAWIDHGTRNAEGVLVDMRSDPIESTRAAIRYLKSIHKNTRAWDREFDVDTNTLHPAMRWAWAFWAYNDGPSDTKVFYGRAKGDSSKFDAVCRRAAHDKESNEYNAKIFAIRAALAEWVPRDGSLIQSLKQTDPHSVRTVADAHIDSFLKLASLRDKKTATRLLLQARAGYVADAEQETHSEYYLEGARAEIKEQLFNCRIKERDGVLEAQKAEDRRHVRVLSDGRMIASYRINSRKYDTEIVPVKFTKNRSINSIARNLTADPRLVSEIETIIKDLNPEIAGIRGRNPIIPAGTNVRVPGRYISVPNERLSFLTNRYYPGMRYSKAAEQLKQLVGKSHRGRDRIEVGDVILVPTIGIPSA